MTKTITVLSPMDVKPGSIDPQGRVVKKATLTAGEKGIVVVGADFENGEYGAYMWPNGSGWTVDGRVGA